MLPSGNRGPATDSTSNTSRCESEQPCIHPRFSNHPHPQEARLLFISLLAAECRQHVCPVIDHGVVEARKLAENLSQFNFRHQHAL